MRMLMAMIYMKYHSSNHNTWNDGGDLAPPPQRRRRRRPPPPPPRNLPFVTLPARRHSAATLLSVESNQNVESETGVQTFSSTAKEPADRGSSEKRPMTDGFNGRLIWSHVESKMWSQNSIITSRNRENHLNCCHTTRQILRLKCTKIQFRLGLCPRPRCLTALLQTS